jgi:hypothetical protein
VLKKVKKSRKKVAKARKRIVPKAATSQVARKVAPRQKWHTVWEDKSSPKCHTTYDQVLNSLVFLFLTDILVPQECHDEFETKCHTEHSDECHDEYTKSCQDLQQKRVLDRLQHRLHRQARQQLPRRVQERVQHRV